MQPKQYTQHDLDVIQRLVEVETKLEQVETTLGDFKDSNEKRLDELLALMQPRESTTEVVLTWVGKNWKYLAIIIALATGSTTLAKALELFQ